MTRNKITIGSISHGTLRVEDLFFAFLAEIEYLDKSLITDGEIHVLADSDPDEWTEEHYEVAYWAVNETLFDILNELADDMPYVYFGAHEGDGSDFGFWIDWWNIENDVEEGYIFQTDGFPGIMPDAGYILVINDHGNATLYDDKGDEIWAVV